MNQIKFSNNWNNKLNCKSFSTIRIRNPRKYKLGITYEIIKTKNGRPEKCFGRARIDFLKSFHIMDISEPICRLDTGYNKEDFLKIIRRMYPNIDFNQTPFCILILTYIN